MQASGGQELYYPLLAHCLVTSKHLVNLLREHVSTVGVLECICRFSTLEWPVDFHLTRRGVPCPSLETADPPEL